MIIVYGTRSSESDTRLAAPCQRCGQVALVQTDWRRYFHVMFIPTFPVESHRSIHCEACGNGFEANGSSPLWTFIGTILIVMGVLGAAGGQVIRHFVGKASSASITAAATTTATPTASTAAAPPPTPSASASAAPRAAAKPAVAKPSHPTPPSSAHHRK